MSIANSFNSIPVAQTGSNPATSKHAFSILKGCLGFQEQHSSLRIIVLPGAPEALIDALGDAEPHGLLHALDFLAAREEGNPQSRPQPLYAFHIMLRAYGWVLSLLDKAMSEVGPMVGANLLKLTSMLALPLICGVALPSRTGLPFCHFAHDLSACGQKCKNLACKVSCCRGSYRKETRVTAIKAKQGNWAKRTCQGLRDLPWERKGKDCGKEKGQLHLCQKSCWKRLSELENPCTAVTVGSKRLLASMKGKETCGSDGFYFRFQHQFGAIQLCLW
eukprot:scaffold58758_cov16-Tisochrysis_lutea.AAC.1